MDDKLALLLKEYDALRKEADQSIALMPEIAKSVGVAVAGALIGLKQGVLAEAIVLSTPMVIMGVVAAFAHTHAKLEKTSRRLMDVENRVFLLVKQPLLVHETRMNIIRLERKTWTWVLGSLVALIVYFGATAILFDRFSYVFDGATHNKRDVWIHLYWIIVVVAALYAVLSALRIIRQRNRISDIALLDEEKKSKVPDHYK